MVFPLFLSFLSRGLPPLNVSEDGEVNRKKYFIFEKKTKTYVLFCYNILNKTCGSMSTEK
ncbi:hypothetical protein CBR58_33855 [Bacillus thuringiensis]|nr:hypothetical protein BK763_25320 [Bacillus thuringiensis serovar thompsoni]PNK38078.1 hypothetical protein CBR58_33855 [Bacillus thuringiensis]